VVGHVHGGASGLGTGRQHIPKNFAKANSIEGLVHIGRFSAVYDLPDGLLAGFVRQHPENDRSPMNLGKTRMRLQRFFRTMRRHGRNGCQSAVKAFF
jgi:hypothetical protein